jgi:5-methylcytosine-specific restriction endonuclease McrA
MQNYHKENIDTIRERQRNYYQENADRLCEYQQNYYQENVERIHEQRQNYRQTSKGKNSYMRCEQKRRAIENKCHSLPYKQEDILNLFNGECAYCGNKVKLSLDHFIPLTKGGSDVKGNLLPACLSCNSSKGNKDAIDWYKKQPFFNQKRLKQILKILGKTESNYDQIPLF